MSLSSDNDRQDADRCDVTYGDVIDKSARKNVSICRRSEEDGELSRVYVSQSNLLHIVFTHDTSPHHYHQQHNFIIHVQGNKTADGFNSKVCILNCLLFAYVHRFTSDKELHMLKIEAIYGFFYVACSCRLF